MRLYIKGAMPSYYAMLLGLLVHISCCLRFVIKRPFKLYLNVIILYNVLYVLTVSADYRLVH